MAKRIVSGPGAAEDLAAPRIEESNRRTGRRCRLPQSRGSNTDPFASGKTADNHWIVTGPHIMLFEPPSKALGDTEAKDPDPNKP